MIDKVKNWWNQNVDKKQLTTIVVAGVVVGGMAYGLKQAGFGKVATVVKGG